jgi:hypothetical protein
MMGFAALDPSYGLRGLGNLQAGRAQEAKNHDTTINKIVSSIICVYRGRRVADRSPTKSNRLVENRPSPASPGQAPRIVGCARPGRPAGPGHHPLPLHAIIGRAIIRYWY